MHIAYMALFALVCAGGGWALVRFRLKHEARRREELERLVRERTRELAAHASALEAANRRLEEASFTDPLTGLGNRRSLRHTVPQRIANLARGSQLAFMVADLDCLKPINDDYGHEAGDRVLIQVSRILRDCVPDADTVIRWGGDEFVIVHACADPEAAAKLAERIRLSVSTHRYRLPGTTLARTSCSIGFSMFPFVRAAAGLLTWEDVLRLADAALYRAKGRRNAWVGWSGCDVAPDLADRIVADPEAAEAESLIRTCSSQIASGETIELLLRRALTRAR